MKRASRIGSAASAVFLMAAGVIHLGGAVAPHGAVPDQVKIEAERRESKPTLSPQLASLYMGGIGLTNHLKDPEERRARRRNFQEGGDYDGNDGDRVGDLAMSIQRYQLRGISLPVQLVAPSLRRPPVTVMAKDAPIGDILELIFRQAGVKYVVDPQVRSRVSIIAQSDSFSHVLHEVLSNAEPEVSLRLEKGVYIVQPATSISQEGK